jgi:hypothetical protein
VSHTVLKKVFPAQFGEPLVKNEEEDRKDE